MPKAFEAMVEKIVSLVGRKVRHVVKPLLLLEDYSDETMAEREYRNSFTEAFRRIG